MNENFGITEIQVHKEAKELWHWLWQNPTKDKEDYPEFDKIKKYWNNCPLCEYYHIEYLNECDCSECCLESCIEGSAYSKWNIDTDKEQNAYKIYKKISDKLEELEKAR